ncbi:MAG TPA: Plug domain-containing protein [Taishania sp.]|nr:Plug domain-containing protein [Taishania sp.]
MLLRYFNFFVLVFVVSTAFSQQVTFKSTEDSTTLKVNATIYEENKKVANLQSANGTLDFSTLKDGQFIEVAAFGHDVFSFTKAGQIPSTIYLKKTITSFDEMIITGQLQHTTVSNCVQNVRVINSKKIEQMGAQNLTQLFKNELNIQLSNDAILGSGMDLQGISGENVKILVDGVPIIGKMNGTVDLNQINIQNVEKIEIIEGPLSVNYGSDALAGTITLLLKKIKLPYFLVKFMDTMKVMAPTTHN